MLILKPFLSKRVSLIIKIVLILLMLLPVGMIIFDYENKLIVVLFIFVAINCMLALFSIDGLTKKPEKPSSPESNDNTDSEK